MNAAIRAIGSFSLAGTMESCGRVSRNPKTSGTFDVQELVNTRAASPADSLNPWLGTSEGDAVLARVLDKADSTGKARFSAAETQKIDATSIFRGSLK